ncbi:MAG: DNA/RNA non-specific endonuclease [Pontiella sp.]
MKLLSFRSSPLKTGLSLILAYLLFSLIYFHVPWTVRKGLYEKVPQIDRMFMRTGFGLLENWDELALLGKDAAIPLYSSFRGDHEYAGYPSQGFKMLGRVKILENRGYTSGYSDSMKNPLWVSYRIFDVPKLKSGERSSFTIDQRTRAKVKSGDYTHSGLDRGHMAPNYGIATRYGRIGQKETFLMSNIIPQNPNVNRHEWKDLEMRVAKKYGRFFTEVWVITGPVFQDPVKKLDSGIPIPSHYYKIMVDEHRDTLRTLAFLIPADSPPWTRIKKRLTSIDEIETQTGLDFFPELSEEDQILLESSAAARLWPWIVPSLNYHMKNRTY